MYIYYIVSIICKMHTRIHHIYIPYHQWISIWISDLRIRLMLVVVYWIWYSRNSVSINIKRLFANLSYTRSMLMENVPRLVVVQTAEQTDRIQIGSTRAWLEWWWSGRPLLAKTMSMIWLRTKITNNEISRFNNKISWMNQLWEIWHIVYWE